MCNESTRRTENQHFVSKKLNNFPSLLNCGNSAFPGSKYVIFNLFFIIQFVIGCLMGVSTITCKQNPTRNSSPHVAQHIWPAQSSSPSGRLPDLGSCSPRICQAAHSQQEAKPEPCGRPAWWVWVPGFLSPPLGPRDMCATFHGHHWLKNLYGMFPDGLRWKLWGWHGS